MNLPTHAYALKLSRRTVSSAVSWNTEDTENRRGHRELPQRGSNRRACQISRAWLSTEDTEFHGKHGRGRGPRRMGPPKAALCVLCVPAFFRIPSVPLAYECEVP